MDTQERQTTITANTNFTMSNTEIGEISSGKLYKPQPIYPSKSGYSNRTLNVSQYPRTVSTNHHQTPMVAALPASTIATPNVMVNGLSGYPSGMVSSAPSAPRGDAQRTFLGTDARAQSSFGYIPHYIITPKFPAGKKLFRCPQCRYITDRKNNLKRHIGTMHQDCGKILECCEIIFPSKASLRDHVVLFHRSGYKCRYCGRNFCRKALLKRHLVVHSGQKEYICTICDYGTNDKDQMEEHRKVHSLKVQVGDGIPSATYHSENAMKNFQRLPNVGWNWLGLDVNGQSWLRSYAKQLTNDRHHLTMFPDRLKATYDVNDNKFHSNMDNLRISSEKAFEDTNKASQTASTGETTQRPKTLTSRMCVYPYKCSSCAQTFLLQSKLLEHANICKISNPEPSRPLKFFQDSTLPKKHLPEQSSLVDDPLCMDTLAYMKLLARSQDQSSDEDTDECAEALDLSMSRSRNDR